MFLLAVCWDGFHISIKSKASKDVPNLFTGGFEIRVTEVGSTKSYTSTKEKDSNNNNNNNINNNNNNNIKKKHSNLPSSSIF